MANGGSVGGPRPAPRRPAAPRSMTKRVAWRGGAGRRARAASPPLTSPACRPAVPIAAGRRAWATRGPSWRPASWRRASWRTWPPAWARAPSSASPWAWPRSAGAWRVSVGRSVARARARVRHPRHRAGAVTGTPSRRWRGGDAVETRLLLRRRLLGGGLLGRLLGALLGRRGLLLGRGTLERADPLEEVADGFHGCSVWVRRCGRVRQRAT